jgi:hypothetical protein
MKIAYMSVAGFTLFFFCSLQVTENVQKHKFLISFIADLSSTKKKKANPMVSIFFWLNIAKR